MGNLWESIKAHPYLSGGMVLLLFVLIILLMSGGGNETVADQPYDNSAEVNAATAIQARQLELQAAGNQANVAAGVREKEIAAGVSIATLQMQMSQGQSELAAEIARERNNQDFQLGQMTVDLTKFQSTLQATVAGNQIDSQRITALASLQHVENLSAINASQNVALANIQANTYTQSLAMQNTLAAWQTHAAMVGTAALASILSPYPETRGGSTGNLGLNPPVFGGSGVTPVPFVALASGVCMGGRYDSRGNCIPRADTSTPCAYGACPPYSGQNPIPNGVVGDFGPGGNSLPG